mmetsp:Transcript_8918/g.26513  ORF Transcript_8918/g.26513 Transcript_8918/m.26513 type:complete len:107 (-) Transcript_8918:1477-1797(-)
MMSKYDGNVCVSLLVLFVPDSLSARGDCSFPLYLSTLGIRSYLGYDFDSSSSSRNDVVSFVDTQIMELNVDFTAKFSDFGQQQVNITGTQASRVDEKTPPRMSMLP